MKQLYYVILPCILLVALSACSRQLEKINHYQDWDTVRSLEIVDHHAYIYFQGKLIVYDVSKPETPIQISFDNPTGGDYITVKGNYIYSVNNHISGESLRIIDVSNPHRPVEVGYYPTSKNLMRVAVKDNYAYLTTYHDGLFLVIDISDVTKPRWVRLFDPEGSGDAMAIKDDYLYVVDSSADRKTMMRIFDISSPAQPVEVTSFDGVPSFVENMEIVDDYLYLAASGQGLKILDISKPTKPMPIGEYDVSGAAAMVKVKGDHAFIADPLYGIEVVDISNPAKPKAVGYYELPQPVLVSVIDDYVYVVDKSTRGGLFIFKVPQ